MSDHGYSTSETRCGRLPSRVRWIWRPSVIGKHKFPSLMTPCHAPGVTCLPPDEFPLIRPSLLLLLVSNSLYCWYIVVYIETTFCLGHAPNLYLCSAILSLYAQPSVSCIVKNSMSEGVTRNRSHCHGNLRLNVDSKSQRSIPIASRVIINPVNVRGGQSARDDKSHTRTLWAECA